MKYYSLSIIVSVISIAVLSGCDMNSTPPRYAAPTDIALHEMRGKTITIAFKANDTLSVTTPMQHLLGIFKGTASDYKGKNLMQEYGVADPADNTGRQMLDFFSQRFGMRIVPTNMPADYKLIISTDHWKVDNSLLSISTNNIQYAGRLRLMNKKNHTIVAQLYCYAGADELPSKQLMANNAQGLKKELSQISSYCTNEYTREFQAYLAPVRR